MFFLGTLELVGDTSGYQWEALIAAYSCKKMTTSPSSSSSFLLSPRIRQKFRERL
jgi:hypothetical protein